MGADILGMLFIFLFIFQLKLFYLYHFVLSLDISTFIVIWLWQILVFYMKFALKGKGHKDRILIEQAARIPSAKKSGRFLHNMNGTLD